MRDGGPATRIRRTPMLTVRNLTKSFTTPEGAKVRVIDVADFHLDPGGQIALRGESGSGKTTFLHLIAGILRPNSGVITIDGVEMTAPGESRRDALRAAKIGYIFQAFNLLQGHTVLENVLLGMSFAPGGADGVRARAMLDRVGLSHRLQHFPRELSTGQQQRVAVARALANRPKLVIADEPTGNLDNRNTAGALDLMKDTCRECGAALLLVSHDDATLARFDNVRDFTEINRMDNASRTPWGQPRKPGEAPSRTVE
ncbi:ABC-type lipoprotein export system ATPase subunit [Ereboglobus sp. PH5-5]|uniref:ABC transporter ATP-binding protein n=2 Tax=unclassified Ereboglobus TaxID=2626932 RepID=UPI002405E933|nr:ABC transporter ATP-binding protein [Ereboglobus sp. PH5-10]MDF9826883.1 ABC-type lipoprotein export system ATPase subunit [Ereboglobus sp. PH5-10]MDF9831908.1 ABC-type lipoprotein export system ATPase subunit [Ereboglobus sp. PH5-5]